MTAPADGTPPPDGTTPADGAEPHDERGRERLADAAEHLHRSEEATEDARRAARDLGMTGEDGETGRDSELGSTRTPPQEPRGTADLPAGADDPDRPDAPDDRD